MNKAVGLALLGIVVLTAPALAADPAEMLSDPKLEARAEAVGSGLRCLVCQSESIENSNADLARDLRVIVRERVVAGDSDDQIRAFLVARYGDYVLLRPPFKATTLVLWAGPFALLAAGLVVAFGVFRRRNRAIPAPTTLSPEERRRLDALLKDAGKP